MLQKIIRFVALFVIVVGGSYFVHHTIAYRVFSSKNINIINLSYLFNASFTFLFTTTIILLSNKYKDQIGFIFLVGSFVKTGIFLALIKVNNIEIDKNVFLDFFIPYGICLILEVYYVSKMLKSIK
ncbi:hypothetical protein [Aquimarina celericrescens]|uniref:DUF4345 domain-containing protein n=1 Tax=Aquimarina celericrescens TaxID=1964542 RepID=A0ABW5ATB8_9FLAO|nr:hypothetical protein [Aquimarina celericrescens]